MSLSDFYEGGLPVVEYGGSYYWVGEGDPPDGMETEEADFEAADVPAIRRSVGVGVLTEGVHSDDCDGVYDGGRFLDPEGYLSDKNRRVYKKILNKTSFHPDEAVDPYFVYRKEDASWYCIRQGCHDCAHRDVCVVELVEAPAELSVVNIDVSSQEPMLNTFLSKEPRWLEIFRNRHLRELGLTHYVDAILTDVYGLDPDSVAASWYWVWLDRSFHRDYRPLVEFNRKLDAWRAGSVPDVWPEVKAVVDSMEQVRTGCKKP